MDKKKPTMAFASVFVLVLGLALLRDLLKSNAIGILTVSFILAVIAPLFSLWWWKYKESKKLYQKLETLDIDDSSKKFIKQQVQDLSIKVGIQEPFIDIVESEEEFAYAFQTYEKKGTIRISTKAFNKWSKEVLFGVLAHEFSHLENKDSLKGLGRMSIAIFILSIVFFFIKNGVGYLLPFFFIMETFKIRDREYEADLRAVELTSLPVVLSYMVHANMTRKKFFSDQKSKIKEIFNWRWYKVKDKFLALIKLFSFNLISYALDNFSTYPSWSKRINNILESKGIELNSKDLNNLIKELESLSNKNISLNQYNWDNLK